MRKGCLSKEASFASPESSGDKSSITMGTTSWSSSVSLVFSDVLREKLQAATAEIAMIKQQLQQGEATITALREHVQIAEATAQAIADVSFDLFLLRATS